MDSGKYLHRPRRRTIESYALLLLGAHSTVWSQNAGDSGVGAERMLDDFIEQVQTFSAQFEQQLWTADQELLETSAGTLSIARPNRFAWHYRAPYEQQVIVDGARYWTYDVDLEQASVGPLPEQLRNSPAMLLSGDRNVRESFDITETFTLDGKSWVRLEPRESGGDFSSVLIAFRDGLLLELELVDGLDQTTRIAFSDIEINARIDASVFEFDPPAGVDVIGDPG